MKYIYIIFILVLTACSNFRPMYSQDKKFETFLSSIEIAEVETIENSDLYDHISKLFGINHDTKYILTLKLTDTVTPLLITGQANVVKQNLTQLCDYSLVDKSTGDVLINGHIRLIGSYSSTDTPYASYMHERYTKKSITQTAAEELRVRLMLYFEGMNK